jgi:glycosyltransferase involved in cell wall biosynthesis
MRIGLIGHVSTRPVEGLRRVVAELSAGLARHADVLVVDIRDPGALGRLRKFHPDTIHAVTGPFTILSLVEMRLLSAVLRPKGFVMSALQYTVRPLSITSTVFTPDLVLVQSERSRIKAEKTGWRSRFIVNGVDTERFCPSTEEEKKEIRQRMGYPPEGELLLHVGPPKYERNVDWLLDVDSRRRTILVISRPGDRGDPELISHLTDRGVLVDDRYQPRIEEIYRMSDGLLFPATDIRSCIETPLSVLEACACNLPIVTTRFGSLPTLLEGVVGVEFSNSREEWSRAVNSFGSLLIEARTRSAVEDISWSSICTRIFEIHSSMIASSVSQKSYG